MGEPVQLLKKVTLALASPPGLGASDPGGAPHALTFIYGVASGGLCPFETALHARQAGERLTIRVEVADAPAYFGHLFHPLDRLIARRPAAAALTLEIEVVAVTDASDREVVQAVADALAHGGCGPTCGCGCGG